MAAREFFVDNRNRSIGCTGNAVVTGSTGTTAGAWLGADGFGGRTGFVGTEGLWTILLPESLRSVDEDLWRDSGIGICVLDGVVTARGGASGITITGLCAGL